MEREMERERERDMGMEMEREREKAQPTITCSGVPSFFPQRGCLTANHRPFSPEGAGPCGAARASTGELCLLK